MQKTLNQDLQRQIYQLGQQLPLLSDREIARRLKVSRDSASRYRGALPSPDRPDVARDEVETQDFLSPSVHVADAKSIERLRLENNRLRSMNRMLTRNRGSVSTEELMDQFLDLLRSERHSKFEFAPTKYPAIIQRPSHSEEDAEIATLVLSDWHGGETISLSETSGLNRFNAVVLANRLHEVVDRFKRRVVAHSRMNPISKIWLPVLGDMVSGSIHPDLVLTNDLLDIPAAVYVARLLIMSILEIKTLGLPIELDCLCGNHPRTTLKMTAKRQAQLSFDWVIYKYVEQKFEDDPEVTVRVHPGQFGVVEQFGHRFILEHGYGARADNKLPERLRTMFDNPIYRSATGMQGASIDSTIIADKHRAQAGQGYLVNGCLSGAGEFGMSLRLDPIGAIQQMFGVSKKRTRTFQYELDVSSVMSEDPDNAMSQFAVEFLGEHGR